MSGGYQSPAAAFSNALENQMLQREKSQMEQAKLKMEQERHAADLENDREDRALRREQMQQTREDRAMAAADRRKGVADLAEAKAETSYVKSRGDMLPMDRPSTDMLKQAERFGDAGRSFPKPPESLPGIAAVPLSIGRSRAFSGEGAPPLAEGGRPGIDPPAEMGLMPSSAPAVRPYVGDAADRLAERKRATEQARIDALPPGAGRDWFQAKLDGGDPPDSAYPKPEGTDTQDVVYVSADRKTFSRMTPGKGLVPTTGPFNKGTHFVEAPQPPSANGGGGPQDSVLQTADGPVLVNHRTGGTRPITGAGGEPVEAQITGTTRTMMEGAQMIRPHVADADRLAQELDKRGLFGPIASRMREALTKVGTINPADVDKTSAQLDQFSAEFNAAVNADPALNTDALVGEFATTIGLLASGTGRVHGGARGGGSIQMIDYMKGMLSSNSTYQMFHGRMTGLDNYMKTYERGPGKRGATPPPDPRATKAADVLRGAGRASDPAAVALFLQNNPGFK